MPFKFGKISSALSLFVKRIMKLCKQVTNHLINETNHLFKGLQSFCSNALFSLINSKEILMGILGIFNGKQWELLIFLKIAYYLSISFSFLSVKFVTFE